MSHLSSQTQLSVSSTPDHRQILLTGLKALGHTGRWEGDIVVFDYPGGGQVHLEFQDPNTMLLCRFTAHFAEYRLTQAQRRAMEKLTEPRQGIYLQNLKKKAEKGRWDREQELLNDYFLALLFVQLLGMIVAAGDQPFPEAF